LLASQLNHHRAYTASSAVITFKKNQACCLPLFLCIHAGLRAAFCSAVL
jgi:hypothetical protein